MRALVLYESMFGNTELVAWAVADGMGRTVHTATTARPAVQG